MTSRYSVPSWFLFFLRCQSAGIKVVNGGTTARFGSKQAVEGSGFGFGFVR